MTQYWITADRVFDGANMQVDAGVSVIDGKIVDLKKVAEIQSDSVRYHHTGLLTLGFFDIQVNGGGGVFLNTEPTVEGVKSIAAAHRRFGTTSILPTVITDAPGVMEDAALACLDARNEVGICGIHIEGPHISVSRRGTHNAKYVRPMGDDTISLVRKLRDMEFPTLITVAPENATNSQISELAEMGAVVSIGHSDTSADVVGSAIDAGVICFTHLCNAMSPMLNREPGVTGAAIASTAWCSIIADGIHVDPMMIKIAVNARPEQNRMIAVSDAMATVGGPDSFDLYGQSVRLENGRLINAEGSLAGAHLTMLESLRNLVRYGISETTALRMCRSNPAELLGLEDMMTLIGAAEGDLLYLDQQYELVAMGQPENQMASKTATA